MCFHSSRLSFLLVKAYSYSAMAYLNHINPAQSFDRIEKCFNFEVLLVHYHTGVTTHFTICKTKKHPCFDSAPPAKVTKLYLRN